MNDNTQSPRTFDTYEEVDGLSPCMKKPLVVHARRMDAPFRVRSLEGDYKLGKPGDLLMRGIDGELYICDGAIFDRSYDWVDEAPDAQP
jgi:hypothetical protein